MIGEMFVAVPYWWHATALEVLWLAGGILALPAAAANVIDARRDEAILEDIRSDPTIHSKHYYMIAEAARGRLFDQWLTMLSSSLICLTGIVAVVVPNPLHGTTNLTGFVVTVCLDSIAAVTAARSHAAMVRRQRMYELAAGRSSVIAAEMRARELERERDLDRRQRELNRERKENQQ